MKIEENLGRGDTKPIELDIPEETRREEDIKNMVSAIEYDEPEVEKELPVPEKKKAIYRITDEMMEEEKERIKGLNFLALAQYKKSLENSITDMDTTKHMIEMLEQMDGKEETFGGQIAKANIMKDLDLATKEEMQGFLDSYDENLSNLNKTLEFVKEREEELKDVKKTSTYMNGCMLEVLADKTKTLKEQTGSQFKKVRIYYNNIEQVYRERDSMDFLKGQVVSNIGYVRRIAKDIDKAIKNGRDPEQLGDSIRENVVATFTEIFKVEQMRMFEVYLTDMLEDDPDLDVGYTLFLYQYLLYIIYKNEKEKKKGLHKWVEALIMNVLDIKTGVYDLPKSKEDLNKEIKDMIYSMINHLN